MPAPEASDIKPPEIVKALIEAHITAGVAPGGVFVGPGDDEAQQLGCVQLSAAGMPRAEKYTPVAWMRGQLRCVGPSQARADEIAYDLMVNLGKLSRVEVLQETTGDTFLVYNVNIIGGPSQHYDTPETWESLLFLEIQFGLIPVP